MKKQLSYLYLSIRDLVAPLEEHMSTMEGLEYLYYKYGWEVDLDEEVFAKLNQALVLKEHLDELIVTADSLIDKLSKEEIGQSDLENIIDQGKNLFKLITRFEVSNITEFGGPLKERAFWDSIADHLLDDLLVTYIQHYKPIAYSLFLFFGIIRYEQIDIKETYRIPYSRTIIDWDQLLKLVTDPLDAFKRYYKWGQEDQKLDHPLLLKNIQKALESIKFSSTILVPSDDFLNNSKFNPSPAYNLEEKVMEFYTPFGFGMDLEDYAIIELGLSLIPIPENSPGPPSGFLIRPVSRGSVGQEFKLNDNFKLDWKVIADASNLLQLKIFPDKIDLDSSPINAGASFGFHSTLTKPWYIIGNENTTRLELQGLSVECKIVGNSADPEIQLIFKLTGNPGLNAVILFDESDSFIKDTVAKKPVEAGFSPEIIWSSKSGITFNGNISFDTNITLNKEVAGIKFKNLNFSISEGKNPETSKSVSMNFGLGLGGKLGPASFSVEKIGFSLECISYSQEQLKEQSFGDPSLVFGKMGLDLNYMPPKGIGIEVKSEVLTGGGFLELDYENHRYAGVLSLKLALEKLDIEIVAIGLITTRLPNSQKGFSMLISISVSFTPGFQLFFGFTLNGVGGLVGVHRTGKVDVLRERIQSGAMQSIVFPQNVIENASKIISDLRAIFPPQKKHYVVAPFFKIGYSTPTILEVDLGILVEIPFKGRLILLGSLGLYLPNKDVEKRLGEIHVDIFGDFNFAESYILIEGRLRDSHLVDIPLTGGFAFMLDWGSDPQFLLSVGGYHPRYKKPTSFPVIARLAAMIKKGSDFRLSCEYYQAITSNSFQIGLSAEIVYKKGKVKAIGFLGFNAFLQFDPFYFEADIRISVDVSYRGRSFSGVDMEFMLSGPKPWRAQGYAKIKILFFSLKVKFNFSWGGEQKTVPVLIKPDALLENLRLQLQQSSNWSAKLPEHYTKAESLRTLEETEKQDLIIMHPSGYLELRQKLVPLNKTIEKVGNRYVETMTSYKISDYTFGGGDPVDSKAQKPLLDYFSRGQFEDLADSEKISTADFDLMSSGIEVAPEQAYDISQDIESTANDFEEIILREDESTLPTKSTNNWQVERAMNIRGGIMESDDDRPEGLFGIYEELPDQKGKAFKIVSKETLEPPKELTGQYFTSYSEAKDYLQIHWTEEQQGLWQILETEIVESETVVMV